MTKTVASGNFNYGFLSSHSSATAIVPFHCSGYGNQSFIILHALHARSIDVCVIYIKSKSLFGLAAFEICLLYNNLNFKVYTHIFERD